MAGSRSLVVAIALGALTLLGLVSPAQASAAISPTSTISTVAGTGVAAYAGDGGQATAAALNQPRGNLAQGPDGSFYVADTNNNRVRRVAPDGTISTVAGTGSGSYGGDGGPATAARLHWPHDVDVDDAGNVWIADSANNRIRMVSPDGLIRTVVGTGVGGYNGDGIPATSAKIFRPKSVVVTATDLWFADGDNNRIRRVDLASRLITTVAGTGAAGSAGDGGPAVLAQLSAPHALVFQDGVLYVADTGNSRIRRIGADGIITTIAGTGAAGFGGNGGPATSALLKHPRGLALAAGVLYIADSDNSRVRQVDLTTGIITALAGTGAARFAGDGGPAIKAALRNPRGVSVDSTGRLLVADTLNNRIRVVATNG